MDIIYIRKITTVFLIQAKQFRRNLTLTMYNKNPTICLLFILF